MEVQVGVERQAKDHPLPPQLPQLQKSTTTTTTVSIEHKQVIIANTRVQINIHDDSFGQERWARRGERDAVQNIRLQKTCINFPGYLILSIEPVQTLHFCPRPPIVFFNFMISSTRRANRPIQQLGRKFRRRKRNTAGICCTCYREKLCKASARASEQACMAPRISGVHSPIDACVAAQRQECRVFLCVCVVSLRERVYAACADPAPYLVDRLGAATDTHFERTEAPLLLMIAWRTWGLV